MNKRFLILLLIIFVIGIIVYKYSKIKESFAFNNTSCLNFNGMMITNQSDPYLPLLQLNGNRTIGLNFSMLYQFKINNNLNDKLYNTFVNDDFNENLQKIVSSFLATRVAYDSYVNTVPDKIKNSVHYSIIKTYKIDLYNTNFNYFECILKGKDNANLLKFTIRDSTNSQKVLKIENNIPYTTPNNSPITISSSDLNLKVITLNFKTILKYGVLVNQISIKIGNTGFCQDLPTGIRNHFMENFSNITFYMSSGATFRLNSILESGIYASLIKPKIEWTRSYDFRPVSCEGSAPCVNNNAGGIKINRVEPPDGYYALGDYYTKNGTPQSGALVVKKGEYVIPVEKILKVWNNRGNPPYAEFYMNKDVTKDTAIFYALGDYVKISTTNNDYNVEKSTTSEDKYVLIHQDCLEEIPNNAGTFLVNDKGSGSKYKDLSVWTFQNNSNNHIGFPGENLVSFQRGYTTTYGENKRNWRIKTEYLQPQPFPALTSTEIDTINAKIDEQSNIYLNTIKTNKGQNDSIVNPYESVYNDLSLTRKNNTQNTINSTITFYQNYNRYNQEMKNNQIDRNNLSNFIISTTNQLSDIRNKEKEIVNNELDMIKGKVNSNDWVNPTITNTKSSILDTNNNINNLSGKLINNLDQYEKLKSMKRNYNIDPQIVK
jgi:hypothetical protein